MAIGETARLIASLELKDLFSKSISNAEKSLNKFDKQIDRTGSRSLQAGQQIGVGIKRGALLVASAATTIAGGFAGALKVSGDFEAQLNTINTIAHANATDLKEIGNAIRQVAKDTATPLDELTQGYYDLLSAGIKAKDATNVLTAANKLAIGGLATTAETVDLLTTAINTYGGDATKAAADADIFAKAVERGKVTAADLAKTFAIVGPIAASAGIDIKELAAAYAQLTATGVPAAEAATDTRSAILALEKTTPALDKLEKATHKNYLSIASKQGLVVALQQLRTDATKNHVPLTDLLGRVEALNFLLATTGPNFKGYQDNLTAMGNAAGTAAAQMSEREKGLNFQLSRLKSLGRDALISLASPTLPKVATLFEKLNKTIADPQVQKNLSTLGDEIAGLFSDANIQHGVDFLKGAFDTFKTTAPILEASAKATFGFIQAGVAVFKQLPPELQGLLVGGFALNKLTGGLVTNVAGGIVETILGKLKSAVVNVQGAVVNVNGPGLPGVPGAPVVAAEGAAAAALPIAAIATSVVAILATPAIGSWLAENNIAGFHKGDVPSRAAAIGGAAQPTFNFAKQQTDFTALANANAREDRATIKTALGTFAGKVADDLGGLKDTMKGVAAEFSAATKQLAHPKSQAELVHAAQELEKLLLSGRGGAVETAHRIDLLRKQLEKVHDPKTKAALEAKLVKIEGLLPGRQFAARELAKADSILKSHESGNKKIVDLKAVEQALLTRGLPHAASVIREKEEEVRKAAISAGNHSADAIKRKRLAVTVNQGPSYFSAYITGRSVATTIRKSSKFGVQVD